MQVNGVLLGLACQLSDSCISSAVLTYGCGRKLVIFFVQVDSCQ